MSHYIDIQTQIKDKKALVRALERMGFKNKLEIHDSPQNLYGYRGDMRDQKAHVIIRRQFVGGASNDIGFERQENDLYRAHISEFDKGSMHYDTNWLSKLYTYYGVECAKQEAEHEGLTYVEEVDEKNRIRLRVTV